MSQIANNIKHVKQRIEQAAQQSQRNIDEILLLAVSKRHTIAAIKEAYQHGQRHFGENYAQEGLEKTQALQDLDIHWHFIGPLQSNKTRAIAESFQWVHTVDRLKIAERLSQQRPEDLPPLNICIQINIDEEESKSGILAADVEDFAHTISKLPKLTLRGLMAIPKKRDDASDDQAFKKMATLFTHLKSMNEFSNWDTLSMGMSADLELAVANGANLLRIGTDIFGARD